MGVSPVSRSRITGMKNPTYSQGSTRVNGVSRVNSAENTSGQYLNYEFSKETFYDKLNTYRADKKINKNDNSKKEEQSYNFSQEELDLIQTIKNVLQNFNIKIDTLKSIDSIRNTSYFENAKNIIKNNSHFLSTIGIYTDVSTHFFMKDEEFAKGLLNSPVKLNTLTDPINGVLRRITDALMV